MDYGCIAWKSNLHDYKTFKVAYSVFVNNLNHNVAYQDVLNEFDSTLGVKKLTVTRSNLVVTWMDKPHMGIIS